ncbi:MAG: hypothetical protein PHF86_13025 [Candidatus Nanoarchaeia archaeon]|nr:hypothetical protein [Candidatus Nanoarchaeia archaeon]
MPDLTIPTLVSLALADAVNPCELAILLLVLVNILISDPKNLKKVLYVGLAFIASVFVMYFIYGLVIIQFFKLVTLLSAVRLYVYDAFAVLAIILGILNVKDYLYYKPGSFATEMPMSFRPKAKKLISSITNVKGAILLGAFVTLFLLPCTMGPYIIASGILSFMEILKTIPWLILYNLIFVSPMLLITFFVYFGMSKIEDIQTWKDRNIRKLHLVAGILTIFVGLAILLGWI